MRRLYFVVISFCLVLLMLSVASCTKDGSYRKVVPANAVVVAEIDLACLSEDADLGNSPLIGTARNFMSLGGEEMVSKFDEFAADPSKLGIDFDDPAYLFFTDDAYVGLVMSVADEDRLETMFQTLHDWGFVNETEKSGDFKTADVDGVARLVYDDCGLLLLFTTGGTGSSALQRKAFALQGQKKDEQFFTYHNEFADADNAPLKLFVSGTANRRIKKEFLGTGSDLFSEFLPKDAMTDDLNMFCTLSFEKNEAVVRGKVTTDNKELQEALDKMGKAFRPVEGDFLKYGFWSDVTVVMNCNGEKLVSFLKQFPDMEAFYDDIDRTGFDITSLFGIIDGDVMVTMSDMYSSNPDFGIFVKVKGIGILRSLIAAMQPYGLTQKGDEGVEYVFPYEDKFCYLTVRDDEVMLTTQPLAELNGESGISKSDIGNSLFYVSIGGMSLERETGGLVKQIVLRCPDKLEFEVRILADEEAENFLQGLIRAVSAEGLYDRGGIWP